MFEKYLENFDFLIRFRFIREICNFYKKQPTFWEFILSFLFINKTLQINNWKTRPAMNVKISVLVICVKPIIHLLLYNLHYCTFNLIKPTCWIYVSIQPSQFHFVFLFKLLFSLNYYSIIVFNNFFINLSGSSFILKIPCRI